MTPKKSNKQLYICTFIFLLVLNTFFSIHYARLMNLVVHNGVGRDQVALAVGLHNNTKANNYLGIAFAALSEMMGHPFALQGFSLKYFFQPFMVTSIAILVAAFYYSIRQKVIRQTIDPMKLKGDSHFMTDKEIKQYAAQKVTPYTDEDKAAGKCDNNIILAKGLSLSLDNSFAGLTSNVLVVGGSGTGKTWRFVKPNILQLNSSFIITDPKGEILSATGHALITHGYNLKIFSTSDMRHSNVYNPFDYIYTETEKGKELDETKVKVMVDTFIKNVDPGKKGGDPFWDKAAASFLTFSIYFLCEFFTEESRNMASILKLCQLGKADESTSSTTTPLDRMAQKKEEMNPKAKCFVSFKTFKLAPAKTANSVLITLGVDLEPFGSADAVKNMTSTDYLVEEYTEDGYPSKLVKDEKGHPIRTNKNLDLDKIGDEKTALFVNIPAANAAYNFLVSMMYSQFFDASYTKAEKVCPERWHIYNSSNLALSSEYRTKEEAERYQSLYKEAEVYTYKINADDENEEPRYFICNKNAGKEETLVEFRSDKNTIGFLKEVYSKEIGEYIINEYQHSYVKHYSKQRLPNHVQCILDEFYNIGEIPSFTQKLATMRGYELSCMIIVQSFSQLKEKYDKAWEDIVSNCDSVVFLGSSALDTDKYISDLLGQTTVRVASTSESKGQSTSNSTSWSVQGRELLNSAEIARMDNANCIVRIRGFHPFLMPKYNCADHPNFKYSGDANDAYRINMNFLDRYYTCTPKEITKRDLTTAQLKSDKNAMNGNNPNQMETKVDNEEHEVNTDKDIVKVLNETNVKEAAEKLQDVPKEDMKTSDTINLSSEDPYPVSPENETGEEKPEALNDEPLMDEPTPPEEPTFFGEDTTDGPESANDDDVFGF